MQKNNNLPEHRISFSSLNWLEKSPAYFQAMINNQLPKEESASMDFGRALHCFILRNKDFPSEYYVLEANTPSSPQQYKFCNSIIAGGTAISAYKENYAVAKKTEEAISKEAEALAISLSAYIQALKDAEGKTIITREDFLRIQNVNDSLMKHEAFVDLLNYREKFPDAVIYMESEFLFPVTKLHDGEDLFIHGFIDFVIIDPLNYKMKVIELKSTSKHPAEYVEAFIKYKTARQLAMYTIAASKMYENLQKEREAWKDIPLDKITPEWYVVVCQTNELFETKLYQISQDHVIQGMIEYKDLRNRYVFHHEHGWNHSQEYYTNKGIEIL